MARKSKRNKSSRRSGATGSRNPQVRAGELTKMERLLKVMGEVVTAAQDAVGAMPGPAGLVTVFDVQILMRGVNSVKSVCLLLEQDHWEHALGVTRQLFELLVNMEYMTTLPDRKKAIDDYRQFGLLQFFQMKQREITYEEKTGRAPDPVVKSMVEHHLANSFDSFRGKPKQNGEVSWVPSWSRKNIKALAEASPDAMRSDQYEQLFKIWSEQAHAAPGALLMGLINGEGEDWLNDVLVADEREMIQTCSLTFMLFVSLWASLPAVPDIPRDVVRWSRTVMQVVGAPEFDLLPGYRIEESAP